MNDLTSKLNAVVLIGLFVAGYFFIAHTLEPVKPPTDAWFQAAVVEQSEPVLVKFGAPWCGPCQMLDPELDKLAESGKANVVRIEIAEHPDLARHYGVTSIPRLLLFDRGNLLADRVGYADCEQLQSWITDNVR
jgi:thioredoxin